MHAAAGHLDSLSEAQLTNLYQARLARVRAVMRQGNVPALLLVDPINIFYATGARNMTVFSQMGTSRYLLLFAEGPVVLFEYYGCEHLAATLRTIDEIRGAIGVSHTAAGDAIEAAAESWAGEIADLTRQYAGAGADIAVGRFHYQAIDALRRHGLRIGDAEALMAEARRVKQPEELPVIRQAVVRVEAAARELAESVADGRSEMSIWAEFHRGLIAREGEYISTRLLQSGARTFPYFQECGPRNIANGELVCFDTDALGYQGYAVDFSRTFLCGTGRASPQQRKLYGLALEQLRHNVDLFQPGKSFQEIAESAWPIPEEYRPSSYYCLAHGLGMSGEFPNIPHPRRGESYPLSGHVAPGMVICVESYVGSPQAREGVKLEDQILVTDGGVEVLSRLEFDERLRSREL